MSRPREENSPRVRTPQGVQGRDPTNLNLSGDREAEKAEGTGPAWAGAEPGLADPDVYMAASRGLGGSERRRAEPEALFQQNRAEVMWPRTRSRDFGKLQEGNDGTPRMARLRAPGPHGPAPPWPSARACSSNRPRSTCFVTLHSAQP